MFYSTDLLKRKTALGQIWLAANGKKLNKGNILGISIDKSCEQIMDPEIPHALRLQAVLASGVCTVFDRQSQYLLEDFRVCLANVKAASHTLAETAADDLIVARPADINMMEEVSINIDVFAAPAAFPTGLTPGARRSNRLLENDEDAILVPSIPDSVDDRAKSVQSPGALMQQAADPEYFILEVMDAPEFPGGFPDAAFDFPAPGEEGYPADPYNFNEEIIFPFPEEEQNGAAAAAAAAAENEEQGKVGHTAQKEGAKVVTRSRRLKKATVDDPQNMTISTADYQGYISGGYRQDILISRPRGAKKERLDLFSLGPATGKWPKELMHVWKRCNEKVKRPVDSTALEGEKLRGIMGEDGLFDQEKQQQMFNGGDGFDQYQYQDGMVMAPPEPSDFPMPDDFYNFFPGADGAIIDGGNYNYGGGEGEFQAETLRAALAGTSGAVNYRDNMFQLGLTPASENENLSGGVGGHRNKRGRFSNASLRDSRGRLSGRSDDLAGGSRTFEDILEDMQAEGGNLADALPIVEGEGGGDGGVSQFNLVEESGPSMPHSQLTGPMEQHSKTFQVLASLRSLTTSNELSLSQATYGLTRLEAAQVFSHVLVGSSKGFIDVSQEEPYGDITLTFFN